MDRYERATSGYERNLEQALRELLGEATGSLARVLLRASRTGQISYEEAADLAGNDVDEVLLLADQLRLLVPVRSATGSLNWSDALLLCRPGETYRMPNLSRHLVLLAGETGRWDPPGAVAALFREMGEADWALLPALVERLAGAAVNYRVNAFEIETICRDAGLGERVGAMILELKGAGVISPKFDSFSEVRNSKSPVYEINKSIFSHPDTV
jgi:hypothetical protein